jgi:hypothetical protein
MRLQWSTFLDQAASLARLFLRASGIADGCSPLLRQEFSLFGLVWSRWPSPSRAPIVRFSLSKFDGQLMSMGRMHIAMSPEGSRLVYHSNGRAFLRELSEPDARPLLTSGTFVSQTAFSPDGGSLAAWFGDYGGIKRININGGAPVPVCRADNVFGMTWDESGILIGQGAKRNHPLPCKWPWGAATTRTRGNR